MAHDAGRSQEAVAPLGFVKHGKPMKFAQGAVTLQRLLKFETGGETT